MMKEFDIVCFGEILWDELESGRRLGGAPLNVCYHLSQMGIPATIITQVGEDADGRAIRERLRQLGIDPGFCLVSPAKPTSTVEVHLGENNEVSYEIREDVAWDDIRYSAELGALVKRSKMLVFGSLAARSATSRQTLFELIEKSPLNVFDVNLRYPFYTRELVLSLLEKTHLLKLNQEELRQLSVWLGSVSGDEREVIGLIRKTYPGIKEILLTRGHKGAVYIGEDQEEDRYAEVPACNVEVKDTVGSGDSFLAAFIASRMRGAPVRKAMDQAILLSGYVATRNGACPVYDMNDLARFREQDNDKRQYNK